MVVGVIVTLPVAEVLDPLKTLTIFLDQLFYACLPLVVVLACTSMHSLLTSDVE